jgi:hypothetical protein
MREENCTLAGWSAAIASFAAIKRRRKYTLVSRLKMVAPSTKPDQIRLSELTAKRGRGITSQKVGAKHVLIGYFAILDFPWLLKNDCHQKSKVCCHVGSTALESLLLRLLISLSSILGCRPCTLI